MANTKKSFSEATKGMSHKEIEMYRHKLSRQSFDEGMARRDSRGGLITNLHTELFSEANDFAYDSTSDSKDRKKGINPMRQEYTDKMNKKRTDLGVTPLSTDGTEYDATAMKLCGEIAAKLTDDEINSLIAELKNKSADEMVAIIKKI